MGLTIGDVLAVLGVLLALSICAWAMYIAIALLFQDKANQAADAISVAPWKTGFSGFLIAVIVLPLVVIGWSHPGGRLLGLLMLLAVLMLSAVGGAGIALVAARRIRALDTTISPLAALSRGAALVIVPTQLPIFGWFVVSPLLLFVGLGAGIQILRARNPVVQHFQI